MSGQDEASRLRALRDYGVLDTPPEEAFDRLTSLAADLFDAPIALVSLIDAERQWFKSRHGLNVESTPRALAFCDHAIRLNPGSTLVVEDATRDPRFSANPLVTGEPRIRFYAGALLTSAEGESLGTLCVIDTKPRPRPSTKQLQRLQTLARMVMDELELRRAKQRAGERQHLLELAERMSGVGHWRLDVAKQHVTWSDEVYRIHGVSPETFDPDYGGAVSFYEGDGPATVDRLVTEALQTGKGYAFDLRIRRPDGEVRDVTCKAECLLDAAGAVTALYGVFQDVTERNALIAAKEAARQKAEEQARHAELAESLAGLGHWRYDARTRELWLSPQAYAIYGLKPGAPVDPKSISAMSHPEDAGKGLTRARRQLATGEADEGAVYRIIRADGEVRHIAGKSRVERGPDGAIIALLGTLMDVTEQRLAQIALAESEAKYRDLAENSTDIIVRFGRDGLIRYISPACRVLGREPGDLIGKSIVALVAPEHADQSAAIIAPLFSCAEVDPALRRLHKVIAKDGREVWLEGNPKLVRDAAGDVVEVVSVLRDVTAKREVEVALAESERRFRRLAVNAPDIITESTLDGVLTYASPASLSVVGFTPEELIGQPALSLMHAEDAPKVAEMCETVLASRGEVAPWPVEFRGRHKSGRELWMECKPTPVIDPDTGQPTGFTDIIRDITARKVLEAELRHARAEAEAAAAVKSEFLANMSHELRTPLTSIVGFTRLASERPELSDVTRAFVGRVGDASRALLTTVNDILDFSKLEAGQVSFQVQPTSLAALCRGSLDLLTPQAGAKGLELKLEGVSGDDDAAICVDPDRVRQILLNLVGNAVKFTDAGGVTLRARYDRAAETLSVDVVDTGPGIPPEKQDRLFKRFSQVDGSFTRAHGGTGLGLAICKGLVEAMGGEIGVESKVGEGSRFWFRVPAPNAASAEDALRDAPADHLALAGVRVLVVDDHPANRELARLFLVGSGAEVSEAEDGAAAVRLASEQPFDVILMDLRMPGLDGREAFRRIREGRRLNRSTPILAFTADSDAQADRRLAAHGFEDIVAKPLEPGALIASVARAARAEQAPATPDKAGAA